MGIFDKIKKKSVEETKATATVKATPAIKPAAGEELVAPTAKVVKETKKEVKGQETNKTTDSKKKVRGILLSPLVTEKSSLAERYHQYTFLVATTATKNEIKKAVESRYGIKPAKVNIANRLGKVKRFGRSSGQRKDTRKAIITLPAGKSINVYETK